VCVCVGGGEGGATGEAVAVSPRHGQWPDNAHVAEAEAEAQVGGRRPSPDLFVCCTFIKSDLPPAHRYAKSRSQIRTLYSVFNPKLP
jgi:hypothetical protein